MSRRVIVNDSYRYLRIRAAIARDQNEEFQSRWRSTHILSRWQDWQVLIYWEREAFFHQRLLDVSLSFSKLLPEGYAIIFDSVPDEVIPE